MDNFDLDADDSSKEAEEDRKTFRRRQFMYSTEALAMALPLERIHVNHSAFREALLAADRVYQLSKQSALPHGFMLVGDTGTGKSSLIRYYLDSLPPSMLFEASSGVLAVRLQERPNTGRVVSTLLRQIKYPFSQVSRNTVSIKKDLLIDALKQKGSRMLFVDEAHHLCRARKSEREQTDGNELSEFLRELMDECQLGVILCGTHLLDQLRTVDHHLLARVPGRVELKNFDSLAQWQGFVKAFTKQGKAIDLSNLHQGETARLWQLACGGNPRAFKRLVVECVLVCAEKKRSTLDREVMAVAYERITGTGSLSSSPFREEAP